MIGLHPHFSGQPVKQQLWGKTSKPPKWKIGNIQHDYQRFRCIQKVLPDSNNFKPDHEEILLFLEDNRSKLVRLKVASKARYEAYDDNYMSCLTADSSTMKNVSFSIQSRHLSGLQRYCPSVELVSPCVSNVWYRLQLRFGISAQTPLQAVPNH